MAERGADSSAPLFCFIAIVNVENALHEKNWHIAYLSFFGNADLFTNKWRPASKDRRTGAFSHSQASTLEWGEDSFQYQTPVGRYPCSRKIFFYQ
jgi:hypothetical protein